MTTYQDNLRWIEQNWPLMDRGLMIRIARASQSQYQLEWNCRLENTDSVNHHEPNLDDTFKLVHYFVHADKYRFNACIHKYLMSR